MRRCDRAETKLRPARVVLGQAASTIVRSRSCAAAGWRGCVLSTSLRSHSEPGSRMTSKRTGRKSNSTGHANAGAKPGAARNGTRLSLVSHSGLLIEATTAADDGLLGEFYRDYDGAFVLENEKEGYDGFAECLGLNAGDQYA